MVNTSKITLRKFQKEDIAKKIEWINNPNNNKFLHYDLPLNYEKTLEWFANKNDNKRVDFVIEYDGVSVGIIGLLEIDLKNKKAEFYITIGETSYKGKKIGTESTILLLRHAFDDLGLKKIYLNVDAENSAAIALYEKVGFKCEGVFVKDLFHNGQFIDRKRYAIFENNLN